MQRRVILKSLAGLACSCQFLWHSKQSHASVARAGFADNALMRLKAASSDLVAARGPSSDWAEAARLCGEIVCRADRDHAVSAALAQSAVDSCRRAVLSEASPYTGRMVHRLRMASEQFIYSVIQIQSGAGT